MRLNLQQLKDIEHYCSRIINDNMDTLIYTGLGQQYRIEKYILKLSSAEGLEKEEIDFLLGAKWIEAVLNAENPLDTVDFDKADKFTKKRVRSIGKELGFDDDLVKTFSTFIRKIRPDVVPETSQEKIMNDATLMDFTSDKGKNYLKMFFEQLMLKNYDIDSKQWYDTIIPMLSQTKFYTEYGALHHQESLEKLINKLKKERKEINKREDIVLQRELGISESEIQRLKKDLKNIAKRDDKGIQTLFRTTIKNHYTLNEMVDKKANILITVNSIILSLLISGIIGLDPDTPIYRIISLSVLTFACMVSIFFAILSIRPNKTQGDFTEEQIRNRKGNLLFFGNFHNMHYRDFEWAFLEMLNDSDYLYGSMIKDYYFLGVALGKKYRYIRNSLNVFLYGIIGAVLVNVIFRLL